jgi:DNA-binding MarR family transcriptional regulator
MSPLLEPSDPLNARVPSPNAQDRRRLPPLLRRAWYGLNQAFRRRIAHLELTPDQYTVLRTLREQPGLSQRQLTQLMSSDPNTVAALLERMERAGLIARCPHPGDRRVNRLHLRRRGRTVYEQARGIAVALQTELLTVLPEDRRAGFLADLDRLADACRTAAAQAPGEDQRGRKTGKPQKTRREA